MFKYLFILLFTTLGFGQQIQVTNDQLTQADLVNLLLGNSCTEVSNISVSSASSVAYFNKNNSTFPIEEGIVIRNGNALLSGGPFTNTDLSSQVNQNTDAFLQFLSNQSGQNNPITDVAFLQFDFVPLSNSFSFDFLFASNEYGEFQCGFSDVFAFVLIDLNTGDFENLAVVPNTNQPISVLTIRDELYNSSCTSANAQFFSTYNVTNPLQSSLNMRGHTTVMNAASSVIPNNPYRIRLVVGDVIDSNFDSAVFLAAGQFVSDVDFGEDQAICNGDIVLLETGLSEDDYQFVWTKNDEVIVNEDSNQLLVSEIGDYEVFVSHLNSNCLLTGTITFSSLGNIVQPLDLFLCSNNVDEIIFDLTQNNLEALEVESTLYEIRYFASEEDFLNNLPIVNPENYNGTHEQIITLALYNPISESYCSQLFNFQLVVFSEIIYDESPPDIEICFNERFGIDLTVQEPFLLSNLPLGVNFEIQYFVIEPVIGSNLGEIQFTQSYATSTETQQTIWVRVTNSINPNCFGITSFNLVILDIPTVDELDDVIVCSFFELPALTNGNYFTDINGGGTLLFAGDFIEEEGTYYIFSGFDENGCSNQTDFAVTIIEDFSLPTTRCGQLLLEYPTYGIFYTEPNAQGSIIPSGTIITESATVYFYSVFEGAFCIEIPFAITILELPPVDELDDVVVCDSYVLPSLINGAYFSQPNGLGNALSAGNTILSTRNIYIYAEDQNGCVNQSVFSVTILKDFNDVVQCGPYTLPSPLVGGFFTASNGGGTQIANGSQIVESTTLFFFANTTFLPNCTADFSFNITINPVPAVDDVPNVLLCNTSYFLPELNQGEYFSEPNRAGNALFAGFEVTSTRTIYIHNRQTNVINGITYTCDNQSSFVVEIRPLPPVASFTNIVTCAEYALPIITNGTFYTQPNAQGTMLPSGTIINATQTIYIFNEYPDLLGCTNETFFEVEVLGIDIPTITDIVACVSYVLPTLPLGDYYTEPLGQGSLIPAGSVISTNQTIYAYIAQGGRIFCSDEEVFTITINATISIPSFLNIEACEQYELPILDQTNYNAGYFLASNGVNPILLSEYLIIEPGTYTIYVFATSFFNPDCSDEKSFTLTILPRRTLNYADQYFCVDILNQEFEDTTVLLESGLNENQYLINWYFNEEIIGTGSSIEVSEPGIYTIEPIGLNTAIAPLCEYNLATMTVFFSSSAIAEAVVSEDFNINNFISVTVLQGLGTYEFLLDNGMPQTNPTFTNVASGIHTITIRDISGACPYLILEVTVINYPKFFTPNGDGQNETWQINDLFFIEGAYINIFDRFGKLIYRVLYDLPGWDGTYNGKALPSSDYWFQVIYQRNGEPREFRAHFSLRR
jgi:gliding motility-associated-like protein